jgi:hypothetical protein
MKHFIRRFLQSPISFFLWDQTNLLFHTYFFMINFNIIFSWTTTYLKWPLPFTRFWRKICACYNQPNVNVFENVCVRKYWSFIDTNFGLSRYRKKAGLVSATLEDGCRGVNLYSFENIISTRKCSEIIWAGRVERIGGENFMQRLKRQKWNINDQE